MNFSSDFSDAFRSKSRFRKLLDYLWPIYRHELPKFLYVTLLMFCILGIQNLIRATKDSLVNTLVGTETISFLKVWGVMPAAFLVTVIYVKMVGRMKPENIFYVIMSFFLIFFGLFAFYFFPNYEFFHMNPEKTKIAIGLYPNLKWFILLFANWSISLFYVIAELWPNAIFALLFWQFVNNITDVEQSKRFYPLFGLLGQTGLILSGQYLIHLKDLREYCLDKFGIDAPESIFSIQAVIGVVLVLGIIALCSFWKINNSVLPEDQRRALKFQIKKQKAGLIQSFKMVVTSRYILLISLLLICYGISINLVEGPWKKLASDLYKTPTEYNAFVGGYLYYTGYLVLAFTIIGSNIVRKIGWLAAALATPVILFSTGLLFFGVNNFPWMGSAIVLHLVLTDPTLFAVNIGAIQNILSKSTKYTLFDSTKEMSYVPLDDELKTKGKAAADVIGTKLGKSLSSLLQALIFIVFPTATYQSISIYLMIVFSLICVVWIFSVINLNKEYTKLAQEKR